MRRWKSLSVEVTKKEFVSLNLSFRWQALFRVLSLRGRVRVLPQGVTPIGHEYREERTSIVR